MNALPALSAIANDAVRRQFAADVAPEPERRPRTAPWRIALAAVLERAAHALVPAAQSPAH